MKPRAREGNPFPPELRRAVGLTVLAVLAILAVATTREIGVGRDETAAADIAIARGDWADAVTHARSAAEAYVPGSPWPERGYRRLEAIGHDAEARGDPATALVAYGAMRTSALATQSPGHGEDPWRARAEVALHRIAQWGEASLLPHDAPASMLRALQRPDAPSYWASVLLSASVISWLGGVGYLAVARGTRRGAGIARVLLVAGLGAYAAVLWMA